MDFLLGLGIALAGSLTLAVGAELQSQAVHAANGRWATFLRAPRWLLGLTLLAGAVGSNVVALSLAPVSAVQSIGVVALAASAIYGLVSGRVVASRRELASIPLCLVGSVSFVLILASHPGHVPAEELFARRGHAMVILTAVAVVGLAALLRSMRSSGPRLPVPALLESLVMFGTITPVTKTTVEILGAHGIGDAIGSLQGVSAVLLSIASGVLANVMVQRAHKDFPPPTIVSGITIVAPITAALIGILVLGEARLTPLATVGLLVAGAVAATGVLGLRSLRRAPEPPPPATEAPGLSLHTTRE